MRVTQGMLSSQVLFDIENNYQRLSNLQNEASTGNKINSPSDDPIGVQQVMNYKNELAYDQQYQQNASQANAQLSFTDTTMSEATTIMQRARDLAVQGSNGTYSSTDMGAMASEVGQLYSQMVNIGNSQYGDQYIFNGQSTTSAPYPAKGAESQTPSSGDVLFDVGNGVSLPVNTSGAIYFGKAGDTDNAFSLLSQLQTALNSGDPSQVGGLLSGFDSRMATMSDEQADVGARMDRAQLMENRMSDLSNNVTKSLANTQGADMASVITQLNTAMTVQQASLQVGAKAIVPTLVDFLK